jgi:hypothetical protein
VLLQVILHNDGQSFEQSIDNITPVLRDAQRLNQSVEGISLAARTRTNVRSFLRDRISAEGFFGKLVQRFHLSNLF